MHHGYYPLNNSTIHYSLGGSGSRLLICLHGYGESAASFDFIETALGNHFTLLAIDFPFHGDTEWKDGLYFEPRDLVEMLLTIAPRPDGVADARSHTPPWTLLGYSMGGRIALHLLELIPDRIDRLVLLAPDGLTMNPWYWLATQTVAGNRLFRFTMDHPQWFFTLLRAANRLKWVNPGIYKFTHRYVDDDRVRHELYTRWTTMRGFRPRLATIRNIILAQKITVFLFYGRYDRIILAKRGERFRHGIEAQCHLRLLPMGHQLLQPGNLDMIVTAVTS
ncbi:MAG: alpha/beta hydrolase [Bacteroidetes bacterium]|nr:alpha/beta hydrolase [Bacteroidota bacterium]